VLATLGDDADQTHNDELPRAIENTSRGSRPSARLACKVKAPSPLMPSDPLEQRKKLSFEQAAGIVPLPSQLARGEISQEFRAAIWAELHDRLQYDRAWDSDSESWLLNDPWVIILRDAHVYRSHEPIDEFSDGFFDSSNAVKTLVIRGAWSDVLGWLEFVLKHPSCPDDLARAVNATMTRCRLAYRVFDGVVISPIASEAERETIERAFSDLAVTEFHGARTHLRKAAEQLTAGHYADSVRDSIHAVEATARVLEPSAALSSALARLEKTAKIHKALKDGFGKLYGYTSDEKGIRHPLLDDGTANVDETDALFMIGACAAFVSYLINKARSAGPL
jgi:hypothetical protein